MRTKHKVRSVPIDDIEDRPAQRRYAVLPTVVVLGSREVRNRFATELPDDAFSTVGPFDSSVSSPLPAIRSLVTQSEDRRFLSGLYPARTVRRGARVSASPGRARAAARGSYSALGALWFRDRSRVLVCVRRRRRRQVLAARGRLGGGHRKPRRRPYSHIWC